MKPEIGQRWKTRGGWTARVVGRMRLVTNPLVVIHDDKCPWDEESVEVHDGNGAFTKEQTDWDLVEPIDKEAV